MDSMSGKESDDPMKAGGSYQQKDRIEFINQLFSGSWCIFEKLTAIRLVYMFLFNVASAISDVFFEDKMAKEMADMQKCVQN